ncbi:MAG: polyprenyl synthetase family protein [Francisellaceae bacterium]|nr:polyprenyl synthetase family protein [Francisellaceae bacterium]
MSQLNSILNLITADLDGVNQLIEESVTSKVPLVNEIGKHIINCGGKRIRPLVSLLTARACADNNEYNPLSITLATAIEFIHTATLLHDDVIDHATMRRGLISANDKWGNAPAVLVGDFLYSRAFQLLVKVGKLDIMDIIADATNTIAEGEVLQLAQQGNINITESEYFEIIYCKTAKLFEASAHIAANISGVNKDLETTIAQFGKNLGIAFQLIDDALDYSATDIELGKNSSHDFIEGKITLPVIRTLALASADEKIYIADTLQNKNISTEELQKISTIINQYDGITYTQTLANTYTLKAKQDIAELNNNPYSQALQQLCDFVVQRNY